MALTASKTVVATKQNPSPRLLAALVADDGHGHERRDVDALQLAWVRKLQSQGYAVAGVVQRITPRPDGSKLMELMDVRTGDEFVISQQLGTLSLSCCVDPSGVAGASGVLRQALSDRVDVVVTNRFGALETSGGGFAQEIWDLVQAGIPVLTVVIPKHIDAWREHTGDLALELPATAQALQDWQTHHLFLPPSP